MKSCNAMASVCLCAANSGDAPCATLERVEHLPARAIAPCSRVWRATVFGSPLCSPDGIGFSGRTVGDGGFSDQVQSPFCKRRTFCSNAPASWSAIVRWFSMPGHPSDVCGMSLAVQPFRLIACRIQGCPGGSPRCRSDSDLGTRIRTD